MIAVYHCFEKNYLHLIAYFSINYLLVSIGAIN